MDCGGSFPPECMDFDHRNPEEKSGDISRLSYKAGEQRFLAEIAKCDVICANCHRIRTRRWNERVASERMMKEDSVGIYAVETSEKIKEMSQRRRSKEEKRKSLKRRLKDEREAERLKGIATRAREKVERFKMSLKLS